MTSVPGITRTKQGRHVKIGDGSLESARKTGESRTNGVFAPRLKPRAIQPIIALYMLCFLNAGSSLAMAQLAGCSSSYCCLRCETCLYLGSTSCAPRSGHVRTKGIVIVPSRLELFFPTLGGVGCAHRFCSSRCFSEVRCNVKSLKNGKMWVARPTQIPAQW